MGIRSLQYLDLLRKEQLLNGVWAGEGGKLSADDTGLNLSQEATVTWAAAAGMQLVSSSGQPAVPQHTPLCVHSTDSCLSARLLLQESFLSTEMLQS